MDHANSNALINRIRGEAGIAPIVHRPRTGTERRFLVGLLIGIVMAIGADVLFDPLDHGSDIAFGGTQGGDHAMVHFSIDPTWIKSGTPDFSMIATWRSPDGRTETGVWACDGPAIFEWHFTLDESVYLLDGQIEVDYQGQHFTVNAGDTAYFKAGTKALWHVPNHARKLYAIQKPNRAIRMWRHLVGENDSGA